jgi:hypothetical protein
MNSQESPLTESLREQVAVTLERSRQGWANVLELRLIPEQHRDTAERLRDGCESALATLRTSTPTAQDGATMREALERIAAQGCNGERATGTACESCQSCIARAALDGAQQQQPSETPELSWVRPKRETLTLPCSRCARQSVRTVPICVRCWHEKICTPECDGWGCRVPTCAAPQQEET